MDYKIALGLVTTSIALIGLYFQFFHKGHLISTYPTSCMICTLPTYGVSLLVPISLSNPGVSPFRVDGFFLAIEDEELYGHRPMWQWYKCDKLSPETGVELGTSLIVPPRSNNEIVAGFSHDQQASYFRQGRNRISLCLLRPNNKKKVLCTFDLHLSGEQLEIIRSGKPLPASRTIWWEKIREDKLPMSFVKWWNKFSHQRVYSFQPHDVQRQKTIENGG